jgi:hypothetical protein
MYSKNLHGLEKVLNYFSEEELKMIALKEFEFAFVKQQEYDNGLYFTTDKQIWFENKKDRNKRFFLDCSIVKSLEEIQYNDSSAETEIILSLYGNYMNSSYDGWETCAILYGKTEGLKPLFSKAEEQLEKIKKAIKEEHSIRVRHLLSDNPPVTFSNRMAGSISDLEEKVNFVLKTKQGNYKLNDTFYTENFPFLEISKRRYINSLPEKITLTLVDETQKELKLKEIKDVSFE